MLNVIDHPQNSKVIASLMAITHVYASSWGMTEIPAPTFSTNLDMGSLRTHPDLGSAMNMAAIGLPHTRGWILGYQVLVNHAGIIFALAISMGPLSVRLPPVYKKPINPPTPGQVNIDFGDEWFSVSPWGEEILRKTLIESLAYVDGLE